MTRLRQCWTNTVSSGVKPSVHEGIGLPLATPSDSSVLSLAPRHRLPPPKCLRVGVRDLLVVRLQGVLTAAEQHLVKSLNHKGRDLLKQVRTHLIETARPVLEAMVEKVTGVKVVTLHHDISTKTGERVILFTLAHSPDYREAKRT